MNITGGGLEFEASIDGGNFQRQINQIKDQLKDLTDSANKQASSIEGFAKKAATAAAGFFSLQAATGFVKEMVAVRGEFQQIEVAFTTMLKSKDAADKLMAQAVQLAAITPFTLQEVASGSKQLLAYGFAAEDVTKNLESLGNIASGVGSSLNDIVYLYGTLKASGRVTQIDINQFAGRGIPIYQALADVMKVNVDQVRAYVSAGKIGFPEVEKAFNGLTSAGGQFYNLMQEQSKTLTGQLSNLEDAWSRMLNDIGKQNEGLFADAIGGAIDLVNNYQKIIDIIEGLIIVYGAYRAAVLLNSVTVGGWSFAEGAHIQLLIAKEAVMKSITSTTASGAIAIAGYTSVIAALAGVVYSFVQYQNAEDIAQKAVNKAMDEGSLAADNERGKIQGLVDIVQSHTSTKAQQKAAYDDLQKEMGNYLKSYSLEEVAAGKAAGAIALYTGSIALATATEKEYASYKGLTEKLDELNKKGIDAVGSWDRLKISLTNTFKGILGIDKSLYAGLTDGDKADEDIVKVMKKRAEDAQKALIKANPAIKKALADAAKKAAGEKATGLTGDKYADFNDLFTKGAVANFDQLVKIAPDKAALEKIQKAVTEAYEAMAPGDKLKAGLKEKIQSVTKLIDDSYSTSTKAIVKASNDRKKFLEDLNKQELEVSRKTLSDNDEALKAIHDKYELQRASAAKKGFKPGSGVVQRINNLEIKETGTVRYDQDTTELIKRLDKQKELQIEYEQYVTKFGVEAAKNKYATLKTLDSSYFDELVNEQKKLTDIPADKRTGGQTNRLNSITVKLNEETKRLREETHSQLEDALQASETYTTKRLKLVDDYLKQKRILETSADVQDREGRLKELEQQKNENLDVIGKENIEKLNSYQNLFNNLDTLSTAQAKNEINRLKGVAAAALAVGKITPKTFKEIIKALDGAEAKVLDRLPTGLRNVASGFSDLANAVGQFDEGLAKALSTLGNILNSTATLKDNFNTLSDKSITDPFTKISAGLGVLGAGLGIVTSVIGLFSNAKEKAEQQKYTLDLQLKATEAVNKALERQLALTKEIYGPERLEAYKKDLKDIEAAQKDASAKLQGKLTLTGNKIVDDNYIKKLNNGEKPNRGSFNKYDDDYEKVKKLGLIVDISNKSLAELNKLMDEGKLDEKTSAIVQSMIDLDKQWKETKNALTQEITGINFDSLNDEIRNIFDSGEASAEKFADAIEKSIRSAFSNAFKRNEIETAMQPFYDQLYQAGKDGVFTEQEIADLRAQKEAIAKVLEEKAKAYEAIIGNDDPVSDNTATSAIKTITEDTASIIAGTLKGTQLNTYNSLQQQIKDSQSNLAFNQEMLAYSVRNIELLESINTNTKGTKENTDRLQAIEASLSSIDKKMNSSGNTLAANGR